LLKKSCEYRQRPLQHLQSHMTVHARAKDVDDLASASPPYRNAPEYETGFSVLRKFIGARILVGSRGVARKEIRMPRELPKRTMRIFGVMVITL
jgi:hypothetical protein